MKTKLHTNARQTKQGWIGYISCYQQRIYLWTQYTGIYRTNKTEAIIDAEELKTDILAIHITPTVLSAVA